MERLRWGLLSTARINERLIPAIGRSRRSELVAVASRDEARAQAYASARAITRAHGEYEEMLEDREVDVVYISLPNSEHADWAVRAATAGKHVLCEKPLALCAADVDRMATAAAANEVALMEAAMYRYHPQTARVRQLVLEGAIGAVRFVQARFCFSLLNDPDIRRDPEKGGGSLWDIGSYPISLSRAVLDEEPESVCGWQQTSAAGVDMTFTGQLRFPSGAVLQFASSFAAVPGWEMQIVGGKGMIHLDHPYLNQVGSSATIHLVSGGTAGGATFGDSTEHLDREQIRFEDCNAYRDEVENVEAVILDGAAPAISTEFSRANVAAIEALYQSARAGGTVAVEGE